MTNGPYLTWREAPGTIDAIGGWASDVATLTGGEPRRVRVATATASLFDVLRTRAGARRAVHGRRRSVGRSRASSRTRCGANGSAARPTCSAARSCSTAGPYTITGVMPAGFNFPDDETCAWLPFQVRPVVRPGAQGTYISMFSADCAAAAGRHASAGGRGGNGARTTGARSGPHRGCRVRQQRTGADCRGTDARRGHRRCPSGALLILLAAVGLLLATATANVASVQLARATTRQRELAIRAAIGAGGRRLAQQLLIENVIAGLLGGAAGVALALVLHGMLPSLLPADFPRAANVTLDFRVVSIALALSALTGVLFGLLPVWHLRGLHLASALTEDGQGSVGAGRTRTARARSLIMTAQVAIAVVLLVGASLLLRSFQALLAADRGYVVSNVLSARVPMPDRAYTGPRRAEVTRAVLDRLRAIPGVTHAAFTTVLPLTPLDQMLAFTMPSGPGGQTVNVHASLRTTSDDYFAAMGIRLIEGRTFNAGDVTTSEPVVVVNRTFARSYLSGSAVGRRIPVRLDKGRDDWTIVGVVDDVLMRSATEPPQPEIYVCFTQLETGLSSDPALVIRSGTHPAIAGRVGPQHHPRTGSRAGARLGDDDGGSPARNAGASALVCGRSERFRALRDGDCRRRVVRRPVLHGRPAFP